MTTGRPFTAKCRSKRCGGCGAACTNEKGEKSIPAANTGRIPWPMFFKLMLVSAPLALHHHRYQFRFFLVGAGQIFPRDFVLWLLLHALLAVHDKFIDDIQVLAERNVHTGSADKLHDRQMSFVVIEREAGVLVQIVVGVAGHSGLGCRALELQRDSRQDKKTDRRGSQHSRTEKLGETAQPGLARSRANNPFLLQLNPQGGPNARGWLDFRRKQMSGCDDRG